jgi:hypothetical protein
MTGLISEEGETPSLRAMGLSESLAKIRKLFREEQ